MNPVTQRDTFEQSNGRLSIYDIGSLVDYRQEPHIVVGIFNPKLASTSLPFLVVTRQKEVGDYLMFEAERSRDNSVHGGAFGLMNAMLGTIIGNREPLPFGVVLLNENPGLSAAKRQGEEITPRVTSLLGDAKSYPLGSRPLTDDPGMQVDGRFLGSDTEGQPTIFFTLTDPERKPKIYKTIDAASLIPMVPSEKPKRGGPRVELGQS